MRKRVLLLPLILAACCFLMSCKSKDVQNSEDAFAYPAITPQPRMQSATPTPDVPEVTPSASPKGDDIVVINPSDTGQKAFSVSVTGSVAHVLQQEDAVTLYGAIEFQNTGDKNIIVTEAEFTFTWDGGNHTATFTPALSRYDVIEPGQSSYLVYYEQRDALAPDTNISLRGNISASETEDKRMNITVDNLTLRQNYPAYATLTGSLTSAFTEQESCSLNMNYVAFYDASGRLLGVWNFTRNAVFEGSSTKTFSEQLKGLPIKNLAQNTASIRACGFGF